MLRVREYRRIDFGTDMIAEAVRATVASLIRTEMPDAELDGVRMAGPDDGPDEAVVVARWRRAGGTFRECTMDAEELTAVLVGWCRLAGVPLPRAGEKAIEPADDGVTLVIVQRGLGRPPRLH
jgi:hypothetical protein